MKAAGFTYKPFDEIKKSEVYNLFSQDTLQRHFNDKNFGTADVYTPNNVPFFKYPMIILKPMKMMTELESGLTCIRLTIDFAEFDMDIAKGYGITTVTTNYSAKVLPGIKISSAFQEGTIQGATTGSFFNAPGMSMTNKGGIAAFFRQQEPIFVPFNNADVKTYDKSVPEFASRNFHLFGGAMQLGTFVIKPKREDYKLAALKALAIYTDEIIKAINMVK